MKMGKKGMVKKKQCRMGKKGMQKKKKEKKRRRRRRKAEKKTEEEEEKLQQPNDFLKSQQNQAFPDDWLTSKQPSNQRANVTSIDSNERWVSSSYHF